MSCLWKGNEQNMAQWYCSLLSEYPCVDTGRETVSIQLLETHRRLRDYKQPLIFSLKRHEKKVFQQRMGGGRRHPVFIKLC